MIDFTPKPLKLLILTTFAISLAGVLFPIVQATLALSWTGMQFFYLWQLITYLWVEPIPLSLSFFIDLGFNLFLLWTFGSFLLQRISTRSFFFLYFGSALFASLATLTVLPFSGTFLAGSVPPVYALLVTWMMLNPQSQLLLFFTIPCKSHWLILGLIGFNLALYLSTSDWVHAISLFSGALFGYFFALIHFKQLGPFPLFYPLERKFLRLFEKKKAKGSPKIFDFRSGEPILNDDQFMDAMLAKISKQGERSLTPEERKRMQEISERKNKNRN